nr:MAG TPA: hypothetical protein [Caudoviricetes sp.]
MFSIEVIRVLSIYPQLSVYFSFYILNIKNLLCTIPEASFKVRLYIWHHWHTIFISIDSMV